MVNQVALVGEYELLFQGEVYEGWWLEMKVDEETFRVKVWKGIADALADKPSGTIIAVKGKLSYGDDMPLHVVAERVSVMTME